MVRKLAAFIRRGQDAWSAARSGFEKRIPFRLDQPWSTRFLFL
jgi:hypothetical protein